MARGDGEDLYDYLYETEIAFFARGLSRQHPRVQDWYQRWCEKTGYQGWPCYPGWPWPPGAIKELHKRLMPLTLAEQMLYLEKTARRCE